MDFIKNLGWSHMAMVLGGIIVTKLAIWAAKWLDGSGAEFIQKEFEKLRAKINENTLLSQIAADDAIIRILEQCIPEVLHELSDEAQQAAAAGDWSKIDLKDLGNRLWLKAKPQIEGGVHDYIKESSFKDATAIALQIFQRFVAKNKLSKAGVIAEPARATPATLTVSGVQTGPAKAGFQSSRQ